MNTTELSPCPFCGGNASLARCGFGTGRVTCLDCGSEGQYRQTHDEAISAWNTRASPAPGRAPLTDEQIEAIATETEDAGHGWAGDFKNISNHGFFEPDSLRAFVRAIESAHGIAPAGGIGGERG